LLKYHVQRFKYHSSLTEEQKPHYFRALSKLKVQEIRDIIIKLRIPLVNCEMFTGAEVNDYVWRCEYERLWVILQAGGHGGEGDDEMHNLVGHHFQEGWNNPAPSPQPPAPSQHEIDRDAERKAHKDAQWKVLELRSRSSRFRPRVESQARTLEQDRQVFEQKQRQHDEALAKLRRFDAELAEAERQLASLEASDSADAVTCCVCMEKKKSRHIVKLTCQHPEGLCYRCRSQLARQECPQCRADIRFVDA